MGHLIGEFVVTDLGPTGVVIEMARDKGDVGITAFTDGFAVVQRFQHRQEARVLLYMAGDGIKNLGAFIARFRGPLGLRRARGGNGGIDVTRAGL